MIQQQSDGRGSHVPERLRQGQIQHHHIYRVNVEWQQLQKQTPLETLKELCNCIYSIELAFQRF